MYIEPNTNIKIYSGIPLDNTYENTIYWANLSEQIGYFHGGIAKYNLARNTYQRVGKGVVNVGILADNLYDCNYLAFQNENFGNKWFYAFITGVDYVNNNTTQITYEIDDMQTWYFDYELLRCFVEREHASNDAIGANLVEEGLELGEYICTTQEVLGLNEYKIVVLTSEYYEGTPGNYTWHKADVINVGGILQCVHYWIYNSDNTGISQLKSLVEFFSESGKPDEILGVFLMPSMFEGSVGATSPFAKPITIDKHYGSFDGYIPRNNKLYTYPYNFLYVSNMEGNSAVYPYEYFTGSSGKCDFNALGIFSANCEITLFPLNYRGLGFNKDEFITLKGFPQCSYNVDTFKAWLAQNSGSISGSLLATAVAGIGSLGLGAVAQIPAEVLQTGAMLGTGTGVFNTIMKIRDHSIQPVQTRGNDTGTVLAGDRILDFLFINKRIRGEFARIIDDYFTMYGYATHRVKIPNIHARQRWTYTKTVGCNIKGQCPVTAISNIKRIYDKGITFWVNPSEVGNYSLSNNTL